MAVEIISIKAIGFCSKHNIEDIDILKYKNGSIIPDNEIDCITCEFEK